MNAEQLFVLGGALIAFTIGAWTLFHLVNRLFKRKGIISGIVVMLAAGAIALFFGGDLFSHPERILAMPRLVVYGWCFVVEGAAAVYWSWQRRRSYLATGFAALIVAFGVACITYTVPW